MKAIISKIYWRIRIVILALRWIPSLNLGDQVWWQGKKFKPTSYIQAALLAVILALCASLFSGCATFNSPPTVQRISNAAKVASYVGTYEFLRQHPESRLAFETARNALAQIEASETIDVTLVLAIMNQLPVKELKGERATVIITAASIVVSDYLGTIPADQVDKVRPLVTALREGIDLGLGNPRFSAIPK